MDESIISKIPLFEGMSPEEQEELRAMMTQTTLRRGETLFNEGDSGDRLYVLLSGKIKLGHARRPREPPRGPGPRRDRR